MELSDGCSVYILEPSNSWPNSDPRRHVYIVRPRRERVLVLRYILTSPWCCQRSFVHKLYSIKILTPKFVIYSRRGFWIFFTCNYDGIKLLLLITLQIFILIRVVLDSMQSTSSVYRPMIIDCFLLLQKSQIYPDCLTGLLMSCFRIGCYPDFPPPPHTHRKTWFINGICRTLKWRPFVTCRWNSIGRILPRIRGPRILRVRDVAFSNSSSIISIIKR